jgi:two-component system osmolarity sensor histidine kinase EnvZ
LPIYPTSLTRAVRNLVGNAYRYGDQVRVTVTQTPQVVVISVEDNGPGIPAESRGAAVKPFARLDTARTNTEGNVGLGLAIVQDMARAHGGTLRLGDSDLGGLKAEIVLPR